MYIIPVMKNGRLIREITHNIISFLHRINPGNFADGIKSFENKVYNTREEYDADIPAIEELLVPLVLKCKEKNRAMRIGTNHGSLSARVMSYWGDSPRGMVESALEFAKICRKHDYHNFLFSMKVSTSCRCIKAAYMLTNSCNTTT